MGFKSTNRTKDAITNVQRVLIVENKLLMGAGIERMLQNKADFEVWGVMPTDGPTLVQEILRTRPDVVIMEESPYLVDSTTLFFLLKELPELRLVVVNTEDNLIHVYDKYQIMLTHATDFMAVIQHNNGLP